MARSLFGGGTEFILSAAAPGPTLRPGTVWDAQTGGSQITDLLSMRDQPMMTLADEMLSAPNGVLQFKGPDDGTTVVWVECSAATRLKMVADPAGNYIPAEARFRIPGAPDVESQFAVGRYTDVVIADETTENIVFLDDDYTGDPLDVGVYDVGQGVTLDADHEHITFPEAGWWFVWWQVRLTAVADAVAMVYPVGTSNGVQKIPVFLKAGKTTPFAMNQGAMFFGDGAGGGALAVGSLSGELTVLDAVLYLWRLDAPYEGV